MILYHRVALVTACLIALVQGRLAAKLELMGAAIMLIAHSARNGALRTGRENATCKLPG